MSEPHGRADHPTTDLTGGGPAAGSYPPGPGAGPDETVHRIAYGSAPPQGSTAFPAQHLPHRPLPGQPVADQRTEQLTPDPWPQSSDTVVGMPPVAERPTTGPRPSSFWDGDAADHHPGGSTAPQPVDPDATSPAWSDRPVAVRRPDTLAGLLLLLAGIAAGVSLLVVWVHGGGTGLDLVRSGFDDAQGGAARLADTGTWQPLAVVFGGAALFLLGLILFTPARTHRFLGALALVVTLAVAAGVLVPLADARWSFDRFTTGFWFAIAVAGLGVLGSLKALMTGPKVR